jgi:hypothetical protein
MTNGLRGETMMKSGCDITYVSPLTVWISVRLKRFSMIEVADGFDYHKRDAEGVSLLVQTSQTPYNFCRRAV